MVAAIITVWGPNGDATPASTALELPMLDRTKFVHLADFDGQPILLNFWGNECPPCIGQMPLLLPQWRRDPSVQSLGIGVDDGASALHRIVQFSLRYPQLIAPAQPEAPMCRFGNMLGRCRTRWS